MLIAVMLVSSAFAHAESVVAEASSPFYSRIYAESLTLEGEGGYSASTSAKGLMLLHGPFAAYAGVQAESYAPAGGGIRRISPLAGLEADFSLLRLFAEYRYAAEKPVSAYSHNDPRFGLTGGYWRDLPITGKFLLFSDTYAELISIPRINWNPTFVAFTKAGLRYRLARQLFLDPFLEAYHSESADPAFGRNALEARSGLRLALAGERWGGQLSFFRRFATWARAPEARWRALISVGGGF